MTHLSLNEVEAGWGWGPVLMEVAGGARQGG